MTSESAVRSAEIAASTGEISQWMLLYIFTGRVCRCTCAMKYETTTSSKEVRNEKSAATRIVGLSSGKVTRRSTVHRLAPITVAATSRFRSTCLMPASTVTIT